MPFASLAQAKKCTQLNEPKRWNCQKWAELTKWCNLSYTTTTGTKRNRDDDDSCTGKECATKIKTGPRGGTYIDCDNHKVYLDKNMQRLFSNPTAKLVAVRFTRPGIYGDFEYMYKTCPSCFFIFNDNEADFLAQGSNAGKGNAVIRKYQHEVPRRVAGIPTGIIGKGGYSALTPRVKQLIDRSIAQIKSLVTQGGYTQVVYSAGVDGRTIGIGIFNSISPKITSYITGELESTWPRE